VAAWRLTTTTAGPLQGPPETGASQMQQVSDLWGRVVVCAGRNDMSCWCERSVFCTCLRACACVCASCVSGHNVCLRAIFAGAELRHSHLLVAGNPRQVGFYGPTTGGPGTLLGDALFCVGVKPRAGGQGAPAGPMARNASSSRTGSQVIYQHQVPGAVQAPDRPRACMRLCVYSHTLCMHRSGRRSCVKFLDL
jgi:hypothetical protein